MRTVEEIRAELPRVAFAADRYVATRKSEQQYEIELRAAITTNIPIDRLEAICAAERDGRLATLPVGKIGDVVEWDSGVCKELFLIRGIVIYVDGTRYDLGEFMPVATDEHICRIIPRDEAEKTLGREAQS